MIFPTEQNIAFFKEAKGIQEGWEPKIGDFCVSKMQGLLCLIGARRKYESKYSLVLISGQTAIVRPGGQWDIRSLDSIKQDFIPLFTLRQLIEMLEEKGYRWDVGKLPDSYTATIWNDDVDLECEGPTPSIALGKALIEVMEKEE